MIIIRQSTPKEHNQIQNFYDSVGDFSTVSEGDVVLMAEQDNVLVGVVRLCTEEDQYVLRGISVHPEHQKKGIGKKLLAEFEKLVLEKTCWCVARDDLEVFYNRIGFQKIEPEELPSPLQKQVRAFHDLGHEVLCLVRTVTPL